MDDNKPKGITKDSESGIEIVHFSYYDGLTEATKRNLKQTTSFKEVDEGNTFIVCCGDICFKVDPEEYKEIKRELI